ncbi:anti-sigma-K factor RskA [Actinoalloteichus hoggarensis]|uniref:Regulator of SigK n=1 Tax=Actinoalloteichus hoggarensis TaxID=1470176 RepID=A0A221W6F9_9PSEU|nr:anti-sigma factor [Actinoalloteichus hoggarensis]ASO21550.1 Anti-sigma-K factor rskA [Actinoalloteichus hoggarensis]MBB5922141.1 anti-sigma-K factor RskA [Actinoalloteichus hoggarensis]
MSELEQGEECEHHETAVGWALSSLAPDEAARFAEHLPSCARCRGTVAETEELGALLGEAVPAAEPPAGMRDRMLARIAEVDQEPGPPPPHPPAEVPVATRHQSDGTASAGATRPPGGPGERARRPGWPERPRRRGRAAVALLAVAVAVLAAASAGLGLRLVEVHRQQEVQARQAASMETALRVAADPDMHRIVLHDPAQQTAAVLFATGAHGAVVSTGLPRNEADQMYVLWALQGDQPVPMAGFEVGAEQERMPTQTLRWSHDMTEDMASVTAFAISSEPDGDMPDAPSGDIVASGPMSG